MQKSSEIQILRAFAVLIVLFGHMPIKLPNILMHGYTGVSLFFVISGYVVTLSFLRSFPNTNHILDRDIFVHLRDFYIRRCYRIIPVAVIWVLLYLFVAQFINYFGGQYGDVARWVKEIAWFFSGFFNYFLAMSHKGGLFGQYWSLAVEMQFYLLLPFLLIFFREKKQRVYLCVFSILLVSTVFRMITPKDLIGLLTHTQADSLFLGVLICVLFADINGSANKRGIKLFHGISQRMKNIISFTLVIILFILPYYFDGKLNPIYKYPIYTMISGVIVYLAQRNDGWILGGMPKIDKIMTYIGDRSYSLYVCHIIFYSGVYYGMYEKYVNIIPNWVKTTAVGTAAQAFFLLLVALLASELSYRFIEIPYLNHGKNVVATLRKADSNLKTDKQAQGKMKLF